MHFLRKKNFTFQDLRLATSALYILTTCPNALCCSIHIYCAPVGQLVSAGRFAVIKKESEEKHAVLSWLLDHFSRPWKTHHPLSNFSTDFSQFQSREMCPRTALKGGKRKFPLHSRFIGECVNVENGIGFDFEWKESVDAASYCSSSPSKKDIILQIVIHPQLLQSSW